MKILKLLTTAIALFALGTTTVMAQNDYRRMIEKSCPVMVEAISIDHSYSNVTITEWDKPEIYMSAEIITNGKTLEIAKEMSAQIDVKFLPNLSEGTKIKTEINHSKLNKINKGSVNYKITISIKAPRSLAATIKAGFGNTQIDVPIRSLNVDGKYGNLTINEIEGLAIVEVKFGNIEIGKVRGAFNGSVKYGNITIEECSMMQINAQFGNAKIGKVQTLDGYVNYGSIKVTSAQSINMSGIEFSKCTIDHFENSLTVESLRYGSINASTNEDFTDISIKSEFSPIQIAIGGEPSYSCDLKTQFSEISSAFPVTSITTVTSSKKSNEYESSIVGTVGNGGSSSIYIINRYATIAIVKK